MPNTARKSINLPRAIGEVVVLPTPPAGSPELARIKQLAFWSKLNPAEQDQLISETDHFLAAQQQFGLTAVEVGQRLLNVQSILTPYGGFKEFRAAYVRKSERTAYRYIDDYKDLLQLLGTLVVEAMIRNGFVLRKATRGRPLGEYTAAYHALLSSHILPSEVASEPEALRWVRQLQLQHERMSLTRSDLAEAKARVETHGIIPVPHNYQDLLKKDFLAFTSSLSKIPDRRIEEYIETFTGYVLSHRGISSKRFVAQAIPPTYKRPTR